jgi:hypothetical protein
MSNSFLDPISAQPLDMQSVNMPIEDINEALRNHHLADFAYEKIIEQIQEFESELDENTEVAVQLASFGQSIVMSVTDIGYQNPDLIYFYGLIGDKKAQLIQHVNQLSFLLMAVPKADPDAPPRRIGFAPPNED